MNCQHNTRHGCGDSCLTSHSISHITNMATTVRVGLGCELSRQSLRGFSRTVRHDTFHPRRKLSRMGGQCEVLHPAAAVFPSWCQMSMERCLGWRWRLQNPASTPRLLSHVTADRVRKFTIPEFEMPSKLLYRQNSSKALSLSHRQSLQTSNVRSGYFPLCHCLLK